MPTIKSRCLKITTNSLTHQEILQKIDSTIDVEKYNISQQELAFFVRYDCQKIMNLIDEYVVTKSFAIAESIIKFPPVSVLFCLEKFVAKNGNNKKNLVIWESLCGLAQNAEKYNLNSSLYLLDVLLTL